VCEREGERKRDVPEPGPLGRVVVRETVVGVLEEGDGHQVGVGHQHGRDVEGGDETKAKRLAQLVQREGPRHEANVYAHSINMSTFCC
jgi:hypothetical protein